MLSLPRLDPVLPWHQQYAYTQWLRTLFAVTSRRHTYTVLIGEGDALGYVNQERQVVFINREIPSPRTLIRHDPGTVTDRLNQWLTYVTSHEASHVRFSRESPKHPVVHSIWNCIEDERIERLLAQEFPALEQTFTMGGDMVLGLREDRWDRTAFEGILFWRFEHDRSTPRWRPVPEEADLWDQVRPLVEEGWVAPDSARVSEIAYEIAGLLQLNITPPPEDNAVSIRVKRRRQEEGEKEEEGGQKRQQGQDGKEKGEGDGQDGQQDQKGKGKGKGEGQDGQDGQQDQDGQEADQVGGGSAADPSASPADGEARIPVSWEGLVSATVIVELDEDGPDGPGGAGFDPERLPEPPVPREVEDPTSVQAEGYALRLAPLLKPAEKPGHVTPHRSRGRYRYDREVRGLEKAFVKRTLPSRPHDIYLDLLIDRSGSMAEGGRIQTARQSVVMLLKAAALSRSRVRVTAFDDAPITVIDRPMPYVDAVRRVSGIAPAGGTQLSRALRAVLTDVPRTPAEIHVVAIISDGVLLGDDKVRSVDLAAAAREEGVRFLPVLIGDAAQGACSVEVWREVFGWARACPDLGTVSVTLLDLLTTVRAHLP